MSVVPFLRYEIAVEHRHEKEDEEHDPRLLLEDRLEQGVEENHEQKQGENHVETPVADGEHGRHHEKAKHQGEA